MYTLCMHRNMLTFSGKKSVWRIGSVAIAALLFAVLGACMPLMLTMDDGGMMACPFMSGMDAMCPTDIAHHVAAWESAFAATMPVLAFAALLLVVFVLIVRIGHRERAEPLRARIRAALDPVRLALLQLFQPLRFMYARGILSSRLFDSVA